ncbi:hypothetical protein EHQ92_11020 [Leptospira biflexa]|uniref:ankyrin repeat domain-containing protein n=1 Tax=Leptospira biflexa TaxID=172 RepID=UPI001084120E|nr:ankyrin repeat domain-containing protein [Leptospira biflexa]TGM34322.1 hypothetical protein EHQ89_14130 [Leptospira biflexa]TGM40023.1 hypothetical protein EHQ80_02200 [Leptospira biflexa]TGM48383.1 hypothetical protein EHQ92_11020 [Leptospira biflexa]TGM49151.1 hypothetical protein EHQ88_02055 [Leptospira biflexa]TGM54420.1 hypothetical protein EHQ91_05405 [Leptospira biflexa]
MRYTIQIILFLSSFEILSQTNLTFKNNTRFAYLGNLNIDEAKKNCNEIGMHLPNIFEWEQIYNSGKHNNWLEVSSYFWSSSPIDESNNSYLYINFNNGGTGSGKKTDGLAVICIQGPNDPSPKRPFPKYSTLEQRNTALLTEAALNGDLKTIQSLIKSNVNVNAIDGFGFTALMSIAKHPNDTKIAKALIEAKADIHMKFIEGSTALLFSVQREQVEIVRLLIKANADVNAKTSNGITALMYAANLGNVEIVKLLLEANAKIDLIDNTGNTALDYAKKKGNFEIVKMLGYSAGKKD